MLVKSSGYRQYPQGRSTAKSKHFILSKRSQGCFIDGSVFGFVGGGIQGHPYSVKILA